MRSYPPEKRWDGTGKTPENRRGCTVVKIKPAAIIEAEFGDFALLAGAIRIKVPDFNSKNTPIKAALPPALRDYCWIDSEVDLAKLVRNALAHNGGRFGVDLEKYKDRFLDATEATDVALHDDRFLLVAGKIQITPGNTRHLFDVLKDRVTRIIEHDADERQNADAR